MDNFQALKGFTIIDVLQDPYFILLELSNTKRYKLKAIDTKWGIPVGIQSSDYINCLNGGKVISIKVYTYGSIRISTTTYKEFLIEPVISDGSNNTKLTIEEV